MRDTRTENRIGRRALQTTAAAAIGLAALLGPSQTQNAAANGDTRTLSLYHAHTQENITVTFRRDGSYDRSALDKLNHFLRDWRNDETTQMDPRLFDVVWATWREVGSSSAIRVVSAYRSPGTNAMLRRRSSAVAKNSQHIQGKAMDMHMPDVSMAKVREIGMRLQRGGVGYYPTAGTPFVHLDVGSVRSWPRMPRNQLERLFPDGKTVHLPADGTPLPGYEAALAEIQTRGGSALSYADITSPRRSLWAALFGGEDEEVEVPTPSRGRGAPARGGRGAPQVAALSTLSTASGGDSASVYAIGQPNSAPAPETPPAPVRAAIAPKPQPVEDAEPAKPVAVAALTSPKGEDADKRAPGLPSLVTTPLPPRRPNDLMASALAVADVPIPPMRPTTLAQEAEVAAAPAPPPEPALKLAHVPLPPARPTALSLASAPLPDKTGLPAAITGDSAPSVAPAAAAAYTASRAPMPPARPLAATAASSPPASARDYKIKLDSAALGALMANVAADSDNRKRPDKVDLPSVRQTMDSRIIAGRFNSGDTASSARSFSGGALNRPLQAGIVTRGD